MEHKRSQWASNIGFILAAAGSAVGLGNIWKFPGKVAAGGGGAFLICYALIVLFVGFPVMLAELSIGRSTQKNVVGAFRRLNPGWSFAGGIGVLTLFVIMSYYSVVGGWVMKYIAVYLTGADFSAFGNDSSRFSAYFADFISRPGEPLIWGAAFLFLCIYVVVRGVSEGIERVSKFLMPGLFILLTGIVIYAMTLDGAAEGLKYMLAVDPAKFNGGTVVAALGQAFFSLSVGMGIMVTYGSYVPRTENLAKSAGCICILDSLVALLSGLAIVPVVYITAGPEAMGMGGGFAFIKLPWFDFTNGVQYLPMNAVMEKFTDNLMIPLGALFFCLFVGWVWGTDNASKEIEASGHSMAWKRLWAFLVKFLAPAVIVVILYFTVGRGQGLS